MLYHTTSTLASGSFFSLTLNRLASSTAASSSDGSKPSSLRHSASKALSASPVRLLNTAQAVSIVPTTHVA